MIDSTEEGQRRWLFINDWPLSRFVIVTLAFLVCLGVFDLFIGDLPESNPLVQVLGYPLIVLIIFFPGAAVLRVLRVHDLTFTRSLLYSLGLSIVFVMVFGFLLNLTYYVGLVAEPLSTPVLSLAFPFAMVFLTAFAWHRDRAYVAPVMPKNTDPMTYLAIGLAALLPFLVVVATRVADFDTDRTVMFIAVIIICLAPLLLLTIRTKHYELLIFSLTLSLLLHRSLMTNFLMGYDIFTEYGAVNNVIDIGRWNIMQFDSLRGGSANTSLPMVTLLPIISQLASIETLELFKAISPFILSFLPVGVYVLVKDQFNPKVALIAAVFLIAYEGFFGLMIQLTKQGVAELLLVLALMLITDDKLPRPMKRWMFLLFIIMALASHYAIGYIIVGTLVILVLMLFVAQLLKRPQVGPTGLGRFKYNLRSWLHDQRHVGLITIDIAVLSGLFFYIWYRTVGSGRMLLAVEYSGNQVVSAGGSGGIVTRLTNDALQFIAVNRGTGFYSLYPYMVLFVQLLSMLGLLYVLANREKFGGRVKDEYLGLGIISAVIIVACYLVPNFSNQLYFGRFFHFTSIFLCGFVFFGVLLGANVWGRATKSFRSKRNKGSWDPQRASIIASALILVLFLLVNTGCIYKMASEYDDTKYYNTSYSLDKDVSWAIYSDPDVSAARWASSPGHTDSQMVKADWHRFAIFWGVGRPSDILLYQITANDTGYYIYVSSWTVEHHYVYPVDVEHGSELTYCQIDEVLQQVNDTYDVPYSTGASNIYYVDPVEPVTNPSPAPIYTYNEDAVFYVYALMGFVGVAALVTTIMLMRKYM